MDKVQKTRNSVCYTPSSEPFRNYYVHTVLQYLRKKMLFPSNSSIVLHSSCRVSGCTTNVSSSPPFGRGLISMSITNGIAIIRRENQISFKLCTFHAAFRICTSLLVSRKCPVLVLYRIYLGSRTLALASAMYDASLKTAEAPLHLILNCIQLI
jgi:hypothetical protein